MARCDRPPGKLFRGGQGGPHVQAENEVKVPAGQL
jgi:hypothetical protein